MGFFDDFLTSGGGDPYGGLLDNEARKRALMAGIGGFGDAVLSQGYSRTPRIAFQGLGAGMQGFTQARDDALNQALKMKLLTRQMGREDVNDARAAEKWGQEKEMFPLGKQKAQNDIRKSDADFNETERQRQAQQKLAAALSDAARRGVTNPSGDPAVMQAMAEANQGKAFEAMQQPQPLPADVEAQKIRIQTAGQLLPPNVEAQRIRIAQANREPQLLPPDVEAQKIRMAKETADVKPPTESQAKAGMYASRMEEAEKRIQALSAQGATGRGWNATAADMIGSVPVLGGAANLLRSAGNQQVRQAQLDWAGAKLRFESGATITPAEIEQEAERYFPKAGDSADVIKQKAEARALAAQEMRRVAGRAAAPSTNPSAPTNASPDPLGIR